MIRLLPALGLICLALGLICLAPGSARAHATLVSSVPADGATIQAAPDRLILTFSEPVTPVGVRLLRPNGRIDRLTDPTMQGESVSIALPEGLGSGTAVVSWRVVSSDGHPVGGSLTFVIGGSATAPAQKLAWNSYHLMNWLTALVTMVCLAAAVGGSTFRSFVLATPSRGGCAVVIGFAMAGLLSLPLGIVVDALDLAGVDLSELRPSDLIRAATGTNGLAAGMNGIALVLALASCRTSRPAWARTFAALAMVIATAAFLVHGHASSAEPRMLMRPAIAVHALAVLFWLGSLYPLTRALRTSPADRASTFSRFAVPVAVAALVLPPTGAAMAAVQLGAVSELWSSAYGIVLLMKLAAVIPMYALAAMNRFVLTAGLMAHRERATGRLAVSIWTEIALGCIALAIVGLWHFTPPPRAMEAVAVTINGLQFHAHGVAAMANLAVRPARVGNNQFSINVMTFDSAPLAAEQVDIVAFDPNGSLEPLRFRTHRLGASTWVTDAAIFPRAGHWTIRTDILISDFDRTSLKTAVDIR